MPRNKLADLNNHLFAQLERLNDEDMKLEDMELEIRKAKAISLVSTQIINNAKVTLDAAKFINAGELKGIYETPDILKISKPKEMSLENKSE